MPNWSIVIDVKDLWSDTNLPLAQKAQGVAARIEDSPWQDITPYPETLGVLVDALKKHSDTDLLDQVWAGIYDLADHDRVWIEAH